MHSHSSVLSCGASARSAQEQAWHGVRARWRIWLVKMPPNPLGFLMWKPKPHPEPWSKRRSPKTPNPLTSVATFHHLRIEAGQKAPNISARCLLSTSALPRVTNPWVGSVAWGLSGAANILPPNLSYLCIISFSSFFIFGQPLLWVAGKGLGVKHHITSFTGPFCPCPSRKGKQLELWAAQWLCLFWAEDGISSVGGSDLFLPCNMKHQLWLALGRGEDESD